MLCLNATRRSLETKGFHKKEWDTFYLEDILWKKKKKEENEIFASSYYILLCQCQLALVSRSSLGDKCGNLTLTMTAYFTFLRFSIFKYIFAILLHSALSHCQSFDLQLRIFNHFHNKYTQPDYASARKINTVIFLVLVTLIKTFNWKKRYKY